VVQPLMLLGWVLLVQRVLQEWVLLLMRGGQ